MSKPMFAAGAAALGIVLLASGCGPKQQPPSQPPIVDDDDTPEDPKARAEAEAAFAAVVAEYEKGGEWTPQRCDAMAGKFEQVYRDYPRYMTTALFNAGAVRERCDQPKEAAKIYERVIASKKSTDLAHNQLGVMAARRGDMAAASRHFKAAIEANPATRAPRNNLAAALRDRYASNPEDANFRTAEAQLQNVLAVDSGNRVAFENLARLYYDRGRMVDKAYLMLSDLVVTQGLRVVGDAGGGSADLWVIRGLILMERASDVRALRAFEKAVEIAPDHGDAHMNIAMIALRFRDFDAARKSLSIAEKSRHKDNVETYLGLGVAHRGLRNYDDAKQAFEKAQKVDQRDPRPLFNLGVLYQDHIVPSATKGFDEAGSRKAIAYFDQFTQRAAADKRFADEVGEAKHRIDVIEESIVINEEMADLAAKVAELERKEQEAREKERKEMLEKERRAREAHEAAQAAGDG